MKMNPGRHRFMYRALTLFSLTATSVVSMNCIGGHFDAKTPAAQVDAPTQAIVERITAERTARQLAAATWVPDLHPPAVRGALAAARGDLSLKSAAHSAAQAGVTALGRHVWSFAAVCTDLRLFRPPPMVAEHATLLFAAVAQPSAGGQTIVVLLIAEPGPSALRPEHMGGGRGGTNPSFDTYVHSSVANGPCGETWPAAARVRL
ncbi:MAG: hypothetical protein H7X95_08315 [Deltaproteobacteria bacterium]|nr:hypothetical protein [Deltaproteobacteria bacterium]